MRFIKFVSLFFVVLFVLCISLFVITYSLLPKIEVPTSILILGKGGKGHTAPNLTDTIMVTFLNPESRKVSFLSLPRDIWIPEIRAKLNSAYHYGGFKMAGDSVGSITGEQVTNMIVLDFSLFKELIDAIGGIDVMVENSFIDNKYPISGLENDLCDGDRTFACRYETVIFKEGKQTMDGETALKFVRSRNSQGDEGTDLAREIRQQKVVEAVKEKLLSFGVLLNPRVVQKIYSVAINHTETDIDFDNAIAITKFIFESKENISFLTLPENLLTVSQNNKKYDSQYVFIPVSNSWKEVQEWIKDNI